MELLLILVVGAVGVVLFFSTRADSTASNAGPSAPSPESEPVADAFLDVLERPVAGSDLDYVEFFDLPRGLTVGEAGRVIEGDWKNRTAEEKAEWHAYSAILEDFSDPALLQAFHLKEVGRPTLMLALERMRNAGKSYQYIDGHIEELAEAILAIEPGLSAQPEDRT